MLRKRGPRPFCWCLFFVAGTRPVSEAPKSTVPGRLWWRPGSSDGAPGVASRSLAEPRELITEIKTGFSSFFFFSSRRWFLFSFYHPSPLLWHHERAFDFGFAIREFRHGLGSFNGEGDCKVKTGERGFPLRWCVCLPCRCAFLCVLLKG